MKGKDKDRVVGVRVISRTHIPRERVNRKKRRQTKKEEEEKARKDYGPAKTDELKTDEKSVIEEDTKTEEEKPQHEPPKTEKETASPQEEKSLTLIESGQKVEEEIEKPVRGEEKEDTPLIGNQAVKPKGRSFKDIIEYVKAANKETENKKGKKPLMEDPSKTEGREAGKDLLEDERYKDIKERVKLADKEYLDEQNEFKKLSRPVRKDSKPPKKGFFSSKRWKIFFLVLIIFMVLAVSAAAYTFMAPPEGEKFTDFYILGADGQNPDNPLRLSPNQEGKLIIGMVNHEHNKTSYRLVVTSNNVLQDERTVTLEEGQKLEIPFNFTAGEPGERKMEFKLFKLPDNNNIYHYLYLWLNITRSSNATTE